MKDDKEVGAFKQNIRDQAQEQGAIATFSVAPATYNWTGFGRGSS